MSEYKIEYWLEALNCALEEVDLYDIIPDEAKAKIAQSLVTSAECQSMAFGWDAIPNPVKAETSLIKASHEQEVKDLQRQIEALKGGISKLARVDKSSIYVDRDDVKVWLR